MRHRILSTAVAAGMAFAAMAGAAAAGPHILIDMESGKVLSQDDAFQPWYPASLTKLMTTYVVFRAVQAGEITLKSPVRVSANAAKERPSKMGYKPGSVLTFDNAIKILMVKSANDVATAVAESVSGSVPAFAQRMNTEARRLGMTGSRFVNAHGWHADSQFVTARDLAILATALRKDFPQYAGYFSIEAIGAGKTIIENHNTLIARFDGADGMKTGYTCPSGFNLIATATRNGRTLLAVVLGEYSVAERAEKAAELLAKGFAKSGFGASRLASMQVSGETSGPVNMREPMCSKTARQARAAARGEGGPTVVRSAYLQEITRPRRVVTVGLGGASGPSPVIVEYADVPIPTPRPNYTPPAVAQGG